MLTHVSNRLALERYRVVWTSVFIDFRTIEQLPLPAVTQRNCERLRAWIKAVIQDEIAVCFRRCVFDFWVYNPRVQSRFLSLPNLSVTQRYRCRFVECHQASGANVIRASDGVQSGK